MQSSLAFFALLALTARLAAADVLQNRPTGPIPSFDDPLNIPLDDYEGTYQSTYVFQEEKKMSHNYSSYLELPLFTNAELNVHRRRKV